MHCIGRASLPMLLTAKFDWNGYGDMIEIDASGGFSHASINKLN